MDGPLRLSSSRSPDPEPLVFEVGGCEGLAWSTQAFPAICAGLGLTPPTDQHSRGPGRGGGLLARQDEAAAWSAVHQSGDLGQLWGAESSGRMGEALPWSLEWAVDRPAFKSP